jgi:primosomal protein N' (replication factor Y)
LSVGDKIFVDVVFPLALPILYTYEVPKHFKNKVKVGIRVEVQLKNKNYSAIVFGFNTKSTFEYKPKPILNILDEEPIVTSSQIKFWKWISSYYCCTLGEVMHISLPAGLKLSSETLLLKTENEADFARLDDEEYLIYEALNIRERITIQDAKLIIGKDTIYHTIRSLLEKGLLTIEEELKEKYKPKKIRVVKWNETISSDEDKITSLDLVSKSKLQTNALLALIQLSKTHKNVPASSIYEIAGVNSSVLKSLEKKEIIKSKHIEVSRFADFDEELVALPELSESQAAVSNKIEEYFDNEQKQILLHGVTGSGKTRVYSEFIQKTLNEGKQVLYLLPEIALTTQIVKRIKSTFGDDLVVYHSKMNNNERVEVYQSVLLGKGVILGARSALFLPFVNLGLIIVDEEHDGSYKQEDPAPRYNARDAAVVMGRIFDAKIIMGSATPSIDTYYNVHLGKYKMVSLEERFGEAILPDIEIVDLRKAFKNASIKEFFTKQLRDRIDESLDNSEQIIIFQNRRGYAPSLVCTTCGWTPMCKNCDVQMTFHAFFDEMKCHYCGYRFANPRACKACGSADFKDIGYGTERIEEAINMMFPKAKTIRLDYDTAKSKYAYEIIIDDFANEKYNVLVGTQMVTKGLDFEKVGLVAILNADAVLNFPSYKSGERAFQLLTQVSGRSGRRKKQGKVVIQTYTPEHPVIKEVINHDYAGFVNRELAERKSFVYPPFYRQISIEVKHVKAAVSLKAADFLTDRLKSQLGRRVIGPAQNYIPRIRNQYIFNILIKFEKTSDQMRHVKQLLIAEIDNIKRIKAIKNVRININVDP